MSRLVIHFVCLFHLSIEAKIVSLERLPSSELYTYIFRFFFFRTRVNTGDARCYNLPLSPIH